MTFSTFKNFVDAVHFFQNSDVFIGDGGTSTANQVNACDNTANNFHLTAVQIDLGSIIQPFRPHSFTELLPECLRYYWKTYDYGDAPGATESDPPDNPPHPAKATREKSYGPPALPMTPSPH